ncbi:MAG: hypothetical protein JXA00_01045 [Candidatus Thermoplasmatota archaeon]|nr:hypothetical protein [Candidatus Thermoplasmatota archaeon]
MKKNEKSSVRLVLSIAVLALVIITLCSGVGTSQGDVNQAYITDRDWNYWSNPPHMFSIPTGNVGIGGVPPGNAKLYVKTNNPYMDYAIYAEGALGIKSVSTIFEGTGITGEGGHAGVYGNGYIGLLGEGYYGGWFEGKGYFSGNVGIGVVEMESKLHVDGAIQLNPTAEPAIPSSGFVIYCDAADGALKAKASTGTITILANP